MSLCFDVFVESFCRNSDNSTLCPKCCYMCDSYSEWLCMPPIPIFTPTQTRANDIFPASSSSITIGRMHATDDWWRPNVQLVRMLTGLNDTFILAPSSACIKRHPSLITHLLTNNRNGWWLLLIVAWQPIYIIILNILDSRVFQLDDALAFNTIK